jgi:hypothetical protein
LDPGEDRDGDRAEGFSKEEDRRNKMKIEVYRTLGLLGPDTNQFSFVVDGNLDCYYYIAQWDNQEAVHTSTGRWGTTRWGTTPASQKASESSWLEVLILTGRSRAELEKEIKDCQMRTRR